MANRKNQLEAVAVERAKEEKEATERAKLKKKEATEKEKEATERKKKEDAELAMLEHLSEFSKDDWEDE
jgi:hypothetical protein